MPRARCPVATTAAVANAPPICGVAGRERRSGGGGREPRRHSSRRRRADQVFEIGAQVADAAGNPVLERLPLEQLHGDERLLVGLVDLANRADVGMVQGGRGARFALEAGQRLLVVDGVGRTLQGDQGARRCESGRPCVPPWSRNAGDRTHSATVRRLVERPCGSGAASAVPDRQRRVQDELRIGPCCWHGPQSRFHAQAQAAPLQLIRSTYFAAKQ